jgi:hypothetical protein
MRKYNLYSVTHIVRADILRMLKRAGCMSEMINACKILIRKYHRKRPHVRPSYISFLTVCDTNNLRLFEVVV